MKLEKMSETKHDELLALINPLVDFMAENEYSFFLVAGKDGVCTRHLMGNYEDVYGMIIGMMQSNKQVCGIISDVSNDFEENKK